jgi:hypothetical protein
MAINIGSQNANQINNVEGTQYISGVTINEAQAAAQALQFALRQLSLPAGAGDRVREEAAAVQQALATGEPDRGQVAGRLERITKELGRWSALGAGLIGPLHTLAQWLGPAGRTLLGLLV